MNSEMKYLEAEILIWLLSLSEPMISVIVMQRTSGLSIRNEWSSIPSLTSYPC